MLAVVYQAAIICDTTLDSGLKINSLPPPDATETVINLFKIDIMPNNGFNLFQC